MKTTAPRQDVDVPGNLLDAPGTYFQLSPSIFREAVEIGDRSKIHDAPAFNA
jgi:hypothetical protein